MFDLGGAGMVLYNVDDVQDLLTDNHVVPSVNISFSDGIALKQYIAENGDAATVEITDGEEERKRGNSMAAFSSRGPVGSPASDDIIKPDVTAPGVQILAGNSLTPTLGAQGELFQSISGTSMSSPHVAGSARLAQASTSDLDSGHGQVGPDDHRTPGHPEGGRSRRADPFDFGAGHVDPSGRATADGSVFNPGLVYNAGLAQYVGFLCDAAPEALANPAVTCPSLDAAGSTDRRHRPQLPVDRGE